MKWSLPVLGWLMTGLLWGCGANVAAPTSSSPVPMPSVIALTPENSPAMPTIPPAAAALLQAAISDLAQRQQVAASTISVIAVESVTWPTPHLGCGGARMEPQPTPGYQIMLAIGTQQFTYHTNLERVVLCDPGQV